MKRLFFTFAGGLVSSVDEERSEPEQICLPVPESTEVESDGRLRLSSGALVSITQSTKSGSEPAYWMSVFTIDPATGAMHPPIRLEPLAP